MIVSGSVAFLFLGKVSKSRHGRFLGCVEVMCGEGVDSPKSISHCPMGAWAKTHWDLDFSLQAGGQRILLALHCVLVCCIVLCRMQLLQASMRGIWRISTCPLGCTSCLDMGSKKPTKQTLNTACRSVKGIGIGFKVTHVANC